MPTNFKFGITTKKDNLTMFFKITNGLVDLDLVDYFNFSTNVMCARSNGFTNPDAEQHHRKTILMSDGIYCHIVSGKSLNAFESKLN